MPDLLCLLPSKSSIFCVPSHVVDLYVYDCHSVSNGIGTEGSFTRDSSLCCMVRGNNSHNLACNIRHPILLLGRSQCPLVYGAVLPTGDPEILRPGVTCSFSRERHPSIHSLPFVNLPRHLPPLLRPRIETDLPSLASLRA